VESYGTVIVRRARDADVGEAALVAAAVAEEDFLGLQPPVDLAARAERYRELSRWKCGPITPGRSRSTPQPGSRSRECGATTIAGKTDGFAAR
jgi:hypothetical protein